MKKKTYEQLKEMTYGDCTTILKVLDKIEIYLLLGHDLGKIQVTKFLKFDEAFEHYLAFTVLLGHPKIEEYDLPWDVFMCKENQRLLKSPNDELIKNANKTLIMEGACILSE
ncbi:hypothetical protein GF357_02870 [Candidatus Dojkabacteria bacterium]|nr:hypothetical protein [Candidatus Dojkabacteria bacterium]